MTPLLVLCLLAAEGSPKADETDLRRRSGDSRTEEPEAPFGTRVATKVAYYTDDDGLTVVTPIVSVSQTIYDTTSLALEYDADILTAATVDVRTEATDKFHEVRHGLAFSATHRVRSLDTDLSGAVSLSREADYASITAGFGFASDFLQRNLTFGMGYAWVGNAVGRSHTPFNHFLDTLNIHALNVSLTQLTTKDGFIQLSGSLIANFGYQGSVYRYVPLFLAGSVDPSSVDETTLLDGSVHPFIRPAEQVPRTRWRGAAAFRWKHHLPWDFFIDASYRFYLDDWAITSHTVDLHLYQRIFGVLTVRLRNRFYFQTPASFYQRVYVIPNARELPEFFTMDRELSGYWYDMPGVQLALMLPRFGGLERWQIDAKFDVQFTRYSEFAFLLERTAFVFGGGLTLEL